MTTPSVEFSTPTTPYSRAAGGRGVEDLVEGRAIDQVGGAAEVLDRRLLAEGAFGAEHGDALRRLERQAGRHDLAPDGRHVQRLERPAVALLHLLDHLRHAIGAEVGRAFALLDLADLLGDVRAAVQQVEQLLVERIDLHAQIGEAGGIVGGWRL